MKNIVTTFLFLLLFAFVTFAQETKQEVKSSINSTNGVTATTYDFTTGSDKYYGGTSGAVEVQANVWGMIAGDANGSGIVSNSDVDPINNDLNSSGYYDSDTNMSGIVSNSDVDLINANLNKSSQVP